MKGYFITGTDTDCGKTRVGCALIECLQARRLTVAPFKPVAAGAEWIDGRLQNPDARALIAATGRAWPYPQVNPYCLAAPVSPHIAAAEASVTVELAHLLQLADSLAARADRLLVEGAGGWRVPLGAELDIQRLAQALGLPVILVVGLRLGCLNHALLSAQAIIAAGLPLAGWIGTQRDPGMLRLADNLHTLRQAVPAPCLGVLPVLHGAQSGAEYLELPDRF